MPSCSVQVLNTPDRSLATELQDASESTEPQMYAPQLLNAAICVHWFELEVSAVWLHWSPAAPLPVR